MIQTGGIRYALAHPGRGLLSMCTLAAALTPAGCGILETTDQGAQTAVVDISGDSPVPLDLITSDQWITTDPETFEEQLTIFLADTSVIPALPFNQSYPIADFDRFLIRLTNPDSTVATVRMTVTVDGTVEYDQPAMMSQGGSLEFRFQISQFR